MKLKVAIHKDKNSTLDTESIEQKLAVWYTFAPNGDYVLTCEKRKSPRSLDQNALLWKWCECLARIWSEATGTSVTKEMMKQRLCVTFLPYTYMTDWNGALTMLPGSTSGLTKEAFAEFLTKIQVWAAEEIGVTLPTADDKHFEEWCEEYGI